MRSHVRLDLPPLDGKTDPLDWSASFSNPMMEGPWCRFPERSTEPASDIDTVVMGSLKSA